MSSASKWLRVYAPHKSGMEVLGDAFSLRCAPRTLADVSPSSTVLSVSADYICIDKPPDVRMDGDFDVTVEKLLRKWLSEVYDKPVPETKWIHQLDFSTSGCLVVALHKSAAHVGCKAFENRCTNKEYLAVLEGRLEPPSVADTPRYKTRLLEVKPPKRKKTAKRAVSDKVSTWQDRAIRTNIQSHRVLLEGLQGSEGATEEYRRMSGLSTQALVENSKLRKELRRYLKSRGCNVSDAAVSQSSAAEDADNDSDEVQGAADDVQRIESEADQPPQPLPVVLYRLPDTPPASFFVNCPVAEVPGTFLMQGGTSALPGQWSETLVSVLDYCTYQNRTVTKVKLTPLTGRRHQLRVHCALLGHSIVGDATYSPEALEHLCSSAERMMLHAHTLRIELGDSGALLSEANDPFCVESNGNLAVKLPAYVARRNSDMVAEGRGKSDV